MYIPNSFIEHDKQRILSIAREHGFATLITSRDGVPFASHLPLILDGDDTLIAYGHMAKANEQWQHFASQQEILLMFQGPHAYISPSNYKEAGVPTWNYATVHLYGKASIVEDLDELKNIINTLTHKYEQHQPTPWIPEYSERVLNAVVGFKVEVSRVEAKFKLSQNKSVVDQHSIIHNLRSNGGENQMGVANLMEERCK